MIVDFISSGSSEMSDNDMTGIETDAVVDAVGAEDIFGDDLSIRYFLFDLINNFGSGLILFITRPYLSKTYVTKT